MFAKEQKCGVINFPRQTDWSLPVIINKKNSYQLNLYVQFPFSIIFNKRGKTFG